ncbi:MAG TPA: hypothetical protein VIS74_02780 [Chthoniobacterales bacterium]
MQLKNFGYTIQLLQTVLKEVPEFLGARQLARKAAVAKTSNKKSLMSGLSSASFSTMKVQSLVKKNPVAALEAVEKLLESDPYSPAANQLLREAALAAKLPEIAALALETIIEGNPRDTKTMHELAKHYMAHEEPARAVDIYARILEITPSDLLAVKGGKDASARASMQRGGWETAETYRDLIKDKEIAVSLEQQGRVVRSEEMIDQQLAELHEKIQQEPQSVDTARKIATLYEDKEDFINATEWYDYTIQLTAGSDSALIRKAADLRVKHYDLTLQQWEDYLATLEPDSTEAGNAAAEIERYKAQRAELILAEAKLRVERNPTDLVLRFELGEILVANGNYQEAIPELQKARNNPNVRLRAMNLLGKCYQGKHMLDLSAKMFTEAASEISAMDSTKKEITYNLGLVYEEMGDTQKSVDCMKQIYEVDYGYRDVAARVEGSYAG